MLVVHTDAHRLHAPLAELETSQAHPPLEHAGRVDAIRDALVADPRFSFREPEPWGTDPIEAVHHPGLLRFLSTAWDDYQQRHPGTHDVVPDVFYRPALRHAMGHGREPEPIEGRLGWWCFETTTPLTEGTYTAARGAVDTALTATAALLGGSRAAYGLCRPPGHHATTDLYGGYCFFNNAAIAAHHAVATTGSRVTVLDVDYHHGNGTQEIFYERDDVQYISLHGDPTRAYPYHTGFADEVGAGRGRGATLNIPLAEGADDDAFLDGLERACSAIDAFGPALVVVSLGLDTYVDDPICDLALTTDGYRRCGALVGSLGLPTVVLQEGGYHVPSLGANVHAWLSGIHVRL